jgi:hypothetical protein
MQYRPLGRLLTGLPAGPLRLNDGARTEHFDKPPVAGIEECCAIDPARDREREMHAEPETFGIKPDRFVKIHRPDCDMVKSGCGPKTLHGLT